MKKIVCLFTVGVFLLSCNSFYKPLTVSSPADTDRINALSMKGKFFILHADSSTFAIENIALTADNKHIKCLLTNVPDQHSVHLSADKNKKLKYRTGGGEYNESGVLNEVHFYLPAGNTFAVGNTEIALDKITKIEILEKDGKKTRKNHAIAWGVSAAIVVVAAALIAASSLQNWK